MWGIEPYQIVSFFRQLGLAVAGAGSLWGMVFFYLASKRASNDPGSVLHAWVANRLSWMVYGGAILAAVSWTILLCMLPALAHEGITLTALPHEIYAALTTMTPVYILLLLVLIAGLVFRKKFKLAVTHTGISRFYACTFVLVFVAISYYTDLVHLPWKEVVFHAFHGFHSIFTLGTVLVLDFMFVSSRKSVILQQHIFPLFPSISKVIWVGLSLDLVSVLLIFPDAVILSSRFFFAQTVVAILILNGILLSGVITRRILSHLAEGRHEESKAWIFFANIAGVISITSWVSITLVDFFPAITLKYWQLLIAYFAVIIVLFTVHEIWEHFDQPEFPEAF